MYDYDADTYEPTDEELSERVKRQLTRLLASSDVRMAEDDQEDDDEPWYS